MGYQCTKAGSLHARGNVVQQISCIQAGSLDPRENVVRLISRIQAARIREIILSDRSRACRPCTRDMLDNFSSTRFWKTIVLRYCKLSFCIIYLGHSSTFARKGNRQDVQMYICALTPTMTDGDRHRGQNFIEDTPAKLRPRSSCESWSS
jgi:hypothetical protein